jgi:hypothetical protein
MHEPPSLPPSTQPIQHAIAANAKSKQDSGDAGPYAVGAMPRRTKPRAPEEALAIARALRRRFISPEVEATAQVAMKRLGLDPAAMLKGLMAGQAAPPPAPAQIAAAKSATPVGTERGSPLLDLVRAREGIALAQADEPTGVLDKDLEKTARDILADIRKRYRQ